MKIREHEITSPRSHFQATSILDYNGSDKKTYGRIDNYKNIKVSTFNQISG